jgi:hypothetical protein
MGSRQRAPLSCLGSTEEKQVLRCVDARHRFEARLHDLSDVTKDDGAEAASATSHQEAGGDRPFRSRTSLRTDVRIHWTTFDSSGTAAEGDAPDGFLLGSERATLSTTNATRWVPRRRRIQPPSYGEAACRVAHAQLRSGARLLETPCCPIRQDRRARHYPPHEVRGAAGGELAAPTHLFGESSHFQQPAKMAKKRR